MLYPIKFTPQLKEIIWGGKKYLAHAKAGKAKRIDPTKHYGESWEISALAGEESVVANGFLKSNNIEEIIEVYMGNLVGEKNYERFGLTFPLLIKNLDCHDTLSVQVHPDDKLAAERHDSYGKTEMWYVCNAEPGASIYIGFKNTDLTREEYLAAVNEERLSEILHEVKVSKGDLFFIPAGTVHALGKGTQILEIQQTSNITYRIYDWGRTDANGKPRETHTALAVDAIDFSMLGEKCKIEYKSEKNKSVEMIDCSYFTCNIIELEGEMERDLAALDSFVVYSCIEGEVKISMGNDSEELTATDSILIPAEADSITLEGNGLLMETYIK